MYHLELWRNSRLFTVHYTYRTLQCVLATSLCSLSDRMSYSDYASGCKIRVLDPSRDMRFYSSQGVKWLGHGVDHPSLFSGHG